MYLKVKMIVILNFRIEMLNGYEIKWSNINDILDFFKEIDYMRFFKVNVKFCFLCKEKVDKNGGCNVMMCRCGYYFCWFCFKFNFYS